jgi:hypothetical protein
MEVLMGFKNVPYKNNNRKSRSQASLKRKHASREPRATILIVCEGKKTEFKYFTGLREILNLHPVNIKVEHCPIGSDPLNIVKYAYAQFKTKGYTRVYCVFDKDQHTSYAAAKETAQQLHQKKKIPIYIIASIPCFEYWLLLHFTESTKPYEYIGEKSPKEQLNNEIKKYSDYLENYNFTKIKDYLSHAIARAKRIWNQQQKTNTDNPSTNVHELIQHLQTLSQLS